MAATVLYLSATGSISGAERSLLAMLDALDTRRWVPVVAAPDGELLQAVAARGVRAVPVALPPLKRPVELRQWGRAMRTVGAGWRRFAAVLADVRPALVHANGSPAMCYALPALCPLIWHVRDLVPLGRIGRWLYRRASAVAAISAVVREDLLTYANDAGARITLVPPAVDTRLFHPPNDGATLRTALGLPTDRLLIGLIAQFVPWKRHDLFLDALGRLPTGAWHAVLAGADLGNDAAYVAHLRDRLANEPFREHVTWLPWQADCAPLTAALDLSVLTSRREPFGRAIIEAMACGVPVVAVDEAGPRESVVNGCTGMLVPPEPNALATALTSLLADATLRESMGRAARARAEECYSLQRQGAVLTTLYERIRGFASGRQRS